MDTAQRIHKHAARRDPTFANARPAHLARDADLHKRVGNIFGGPPADDSGNSGKSNHRSGPAADSSASDASIIPGTGNGSNGPGKGNGGKDDPAQSGDVSRSGELCNS